MIPLAPQTTKAIAACESVLFFACLVDANLASIGGPKGVGRLAAMVSKPALTSGLEHGAGTFRLTVSRRRAVISYRFPKVVANQ